MKKVYLKDIAQKLDVSIATVSLALSENLKTGRISDELISKIKQTALEMDYQPNSVARSLRLGKSNIIGLIVADISNPFFGSLAFFIQEYASQKGYSVIVGNSNEQTIKLKNTINSLKGYSVDGLIIVPTVDCEKIIEPLIRQNFPTVLIDRYLPTVETSYVVVDNDQGAYDATRCLLEKGCKNIALITYKNSQTHMTQRKRGYQRALDEANCFDPRLIKEVSYQNIKEEVDLAIKDLSSTQSQIDGIFFASNSLSIHGLTSLFTLNKSYYETLKISCFDKHDAFSMLPIDIPYISQPVEDIAKHAFNLIFDQIAGNFEIKRTILSNELRKS